MTGVKGSCAMVKKAWLSTNVGSPILFRTFLSLALCSSQIMWAEGGVDQGSVQSPNYWESNEPIDQEARSQCSQAVKQANIYCADTIKSANVGASAAGELVVNGSGTATVDVAGSRKDLAQIAAQASAQVSTGCKKARTTCQSACEVAERNMENNFNSLGAYIETLTAPSAAEEEAAAIQRQKYVAHNRAETRKVLSQCSEIYGRWEHMADQSLASSLGDAVEAKGTLNAATDFSEQKKAMDQAAIDTANASSGTTGKGETPAGDKPAAKDTSTSSWGTMGKILAGTAVVGAIAALVRSRHGDSSDSGGNNTSTNPEDKTNQEKILDAQKDPQCQSEEAHEYAHCQKYLAKFCEIPANLDDARCVGYTNRQCGLATTTDSSASASADPPPGLGTQMCKDALANNFCKSTDNNSCHSCLTLRDRKSPRCAQNLAECNKAPTNTEMAHYKATCPTDPVFSDPKWASIVPQEIQRQGNTPTSNDDSAILAAGVNGRNVAGTLVAVGGLQRASDVGSAYNFDLNDRSSRTVQELCQRGWLNNCGPR